MRLPKRREERQNILPFLCTIFKILQLHVVKVKYGRTISQPGTTFNSTQNIPVANTQYLPDLWK